jgi:hypothetical protein
MTCMVTVVLGPNRGRGHFYVAKSVFLASLRWRNNVSCLFLSFLLTTSGV